MGLFGEFSGPGTWDLGGGVGEDVPVLLAPAIRHPQDSEHRHDDRFGWRRQDTEVLPYGWFVGKSEASKAAVSSRSSGMRAALFIQVA